MPTKLSYYPPYGSALPGLQYNYADNGDTSKYRFEFNNQEQDSELGEYYAFEYRIHDARLGRFLSVDPLSFKFPFYSPFQFCSNNPIFSVEIEGLESSKILNETEKSELTVVNGYAINSSSFSVYSYAVKIVHIMAEEIYETTFKQFVEAHYQQQLFNLDMCLNTLSETPDNGGINGACSNYNLSGTNWYKDELLKIENSKVEEEGGYIGAIASLIYIDFDDFSFNFCGNFNAPVKFSMFDYVRKKCGDIATDKFIDKTLMFLEKRADKISDKAANKKYMDYLNKCKEMHLKAKSAANFKKSLPTKFYKKLLKAWNMCDLIIGIGDYIDMFEDLKTIMDESSDPYLLKVQNHFQKSTPNGSGKIEILQQDVLKPGDYLEIPIDSN
jgi:RHS repeat-associated protein